METLVAVIHVLAGVDVVIFALAVNNVESVSLELFGVLAQVGAHKGSVGSSIVLVEKTIHNSAHAEE